MSAMSPWCPERLRPGSPRRERRGPGRWGRLGPVPADDGSVIPLVLGFFLLALVIVAGSVAASNAFTDQRDVQSVCDGAVLAAASAVDLGAVRGGRAGGSAGNLDLRAVQAAANAYLARDAAREGFLLVTTLSPDATLVTARCEQRRPIAFGAMFGYGDGVDHVTQASARTRTPR